MEEKENYGFCPACGANLPADSSFCPECGHSVGGGEQQTPSYSGNVGYGYSYMDDPKTRLKGKLLVAFIFVLIYAITEVLGGISLLTIDQAMIDSMDEMLQDAGMGTFEELLNDMGVNMTTGEFIDMCHIAGVVSIVSAALCFAANVLMYKHSKRIICTVLIAIAALVNFALITMNGIFSTLLSVIVGCIMAYLVYSSPEAFKD